MDSLTYYAWQSPFTDPGLKITSAVKSYSPAAPEPLEVRLRG
jgi:hypothetical protein